MKQITLPENVNDYCDKLFYSVKNMASLIGLNTFPPICYLSKTKKVWLVKFKNGKVEVPFVFSPNNEAVLSFWFNEPSEMSQLNNKTFNVIGKDKISTTFTVVGVKQKLIIVTDGIEIYQLTPSEIKKYEIIK